jgi:superfamily II DNA helicase RecQ
VSLADFWSDLASGDGSELNDTLKRPAKFCAAVSSSALAVNARTEEIATLLNQKGFTAGYFHAGLWPERKKEAQQAFIEGALRVIVATNAFGMGIDKPDVRVVVHADIPGSLENYLQEAGRAGHDREARAACGCATRCGGAAGATGRRLR